MEASEHAEAVLEDLTVAELQALADERGVDVPKSAKKAELIAALEAAESAPEAPEGPAAEPAEEEPADPVESLTVDRGDQVAFLTINGHRFLLTPTDVANARKALEVAGYELY